MYQASRRALTKCKAFFDKHYLLANIGVYGGLYCLGDITCQTISNANTELTHDWQRTKRMTIIGCTILPIMNTYFYRTLDKIIIGSSSRVVFLKLVIDTFAWTPVCYTAFIGAITRLEGKDWLQVKEELKIKFIPVFKSSLLIWPLAQQITKPERKDLE
ncbi:mpv17-like protein 2 isoform X2 [Dendronephthya gigantea]|uniref:mpv17-like protein 2 isoform X2 n=1 Tax=Dendronephthya gigantea TaxID=151771 RepID=UPI00106C689D|nr:mpv17-like protein 2 isoform X2 [Dendronephthya gigantea]